jgi:hypothetical protein
VVYLQADKRISKKTQKNTKDTAQEKNTNQKLAECDHVEKGSEPIKQRSRILKYMKNPTHVKIAM